MKRAQDSKILIIGKVPPPIGGVTIHVERLIHSLEKSKLHYFFFNLNNGIIQLLKIIPQYHLIHLHASNPTLRLTISIVCWLLNKTLVSTIHGNVGRFGYIKNKIDYLSIRITHIPVVLNKFSEAIALKLNSKTKLISAFIPPTSIKNLDKEVQYKIRSLTRTKKYVFCTNAFDVTWDINKNEIYGISSLVKLFNKLPNLGLVISDPSGNYFSYIKKQKINISENVFFISEQHSFVEVIKLTDVFLRTTTTDGDSLSVKEALYFKKQVIASDCTNRPEGTILYKTMDSKDLIIKIKDFRPIKNRSSIKNGYLDLYQLYQQLMNNI